MDSPQRVNQATQEFGAGSLVDEVRDLGGNGCLCPEVLARGVSLQQEACLYNKALNLGGNPPVKVISWNIVVWGGKSNDKDFLEILKGADIPLLQ